MRRILIGLGITLALGAAACASPNESIAPATSTATATTAPSPSPVVTTPIPCIDNVTAAAAVNEAGDEMGNAANAATNYDVAGAGAALHRAAADLERSAAAVTAYPELYQTISEASTLLEDAANADEAFEFDRATADISAADEKLIEAKDLVTNSPVPAC